MNKILFVCLFISLLCGCGGLRGIQRKATTNLNKSVRENNEIYVNSLSGHDSEVKMIVLDDNHTQVKIPVHYTEEIENLDKLWALPRSADRAISALRNIRPEAHDCVLNGNYLTIDVRYEEKELPCLGAIGLFPLLVVLSPLFIPDTHGQSLVGPFQLVNRSCGGKGTPDIPKDVYISVPKNYSISELEKSGVAHVTFDIQPTFIDVVCNRKSCSAVDGNGDLVNQISIHKTVRVNEERIAQLVAEEKERVQQQKKRHRQQDEDCPYIYDLYVLSQQGALDTNTTLRVYRRFSDLNCGEWLGRQINQ